MNFDFSSQTPIYLQVAEQIEVGILQGSYLDGAQIPSTTELSRTFKINPATVLKGMNLLVSEGIIEKRRGLGMFVTEGGSERVHQKRREQFLKSDVHELILQAKKLSFTKAELLTIIQEGFNDE